MKEIFVINNYEDILFEKYFEIIKNLASYNPRERVNFLNQNNFKINNYPIKLFNYKENKFINEPDNDIEWFHNECNKLINKLY